MVDTLDSGSSASNGMEVQVLSRVPNKNTTFWSYFYLLAPEKGLELLLKQLLSLDLLYTQKVYDFQYTECINEQQYDKP